MTCETFRIRVVLRPLAIAGSSLSPVATDLDTLALRVRDPLGYAVLESVLNRGRAEQAQVALELVRHLLNLRLVLGEQRRHLVVAAFQSVWYFCETTLYTSMSVQRPSFANMLRCCVIACLRPSSPGWSIRR
jgi:hypothetical protein